MISIDYAVVEKSKNFYTLPAEFGWSDYRASLGGEKDKVAETIMIKCN